MLSILLFSWGYLLSCEDKVSTRTRGVYRRNIPVQDTDNPIATAPPLRISTHQNCLIESNNQSRDLILRSASTLLCGNALLELLDVGPVGNDRQHDFSIRQMRYATRAHRRHSQRSRSIQPRNHDCVPGLRCAAMRGQNI